ncbi:hypothetical protein TNCV_4506151 [Trichonephila clavipes]|nr:hypothetical protein TNCV_4506151 [Trichonephila clavipes]
MVLCGIRIPDFHKRILFSDEVHFKLNGYVNKQNCRIWSEANPQVYVETPLHPEKLTVWCALWAGGIIGPYFFKNDESQSGLHPSQLDRYDEEFVKDVLGVIVEERTVTEKQKAAELEEKQKAVVMAQQREREFKLENIKNAEAVKAPVIKRNTPVNIKGHFLDIRADLNDPLELAEKLDAYDSLRPGMKSDPNQIFKKKEEFRKPFPK